MDESSNKTTGGVGLIINGSNGLSLAYALQFNFKASNKEVEYEALIVRLSLTRALKVQNLIVYSDSQLVVNQVNGDFEA